GENLVLNMDDNGFRVCVFNRTVSKIDDFMKKRASGFFLILMIIGTKVIASHSLEEFVEKLKKPRLVMMLVMAGKAVDEFIDKLSPLLDEGDVIIDAGNSDFVDTQRRFTELKAKEIMFIGTGVSGGEKGARYGPSIMPGGPLLRPIFESISAKVGSEPCVSWMGPGGAGHYVKMVHNGIEYGDMQLICESYHIMKSLLNLNCQEMSKIYDEWNKGSLDSYLIEITRDILAYKEEGEHLVEKIKDTAGQKGTGKWTVVSGLDMGIPITLIGEAVFARCLSSLKEDRVNCSKLFTSPIHTSCIDPHTFVEDIKNVLDSWRRVVSTCVLNGIPVPAFSSALSFFDGYRSAQLPANLLQAQRDYFGAHTFELASEPGKFHHSSWGQDE
ncbi:hypothetical protein MXB_1721, partial [Myxobolus squamalis]